MTYVGSLARLRNRQTLSMEPFSSKSDLKNLAVSILTLKKTKNSGFSFSMLVKIQLINLLILNCYNVFKFAQDTLSGLFLRNARCLHLTPMAANTMAKLSSL